MITLGLRFSIYSSVAALIFWLAEAVSGGPHFRGLAVLCLALAIVAAAVAGAAWISACHPSIDTEPEDQW